MRSKIINALLLREVVNQMTTLEKWIGYEEEGSLIPRGRGYYKGLRALNCETLRHQHGITQFEYSRILVINGW